ncbi:adenosylmethionine-8-amino-7-oxononanoate aminotransferase [Bradyrhizobium sp. IAR9]|uniref:hypothetical protein n=1 Tax=Bradyrhizobium sp. IAR9 TaxID=2663841 RepID=UPI0015CD183B|nr:adenosylmethionine-8-amino-7-oxononanoate aminotransferase [Bradyrhizobium sp. IAR9]
MAALIARRYVYMNAYGTTKTVMIHAPASPGGSKPCSTAIEAINVLYDENLIESRPDRLLVARMTARAANNKLPEDYHGGPRH